ncbi:MAG: Lon-like protease helical domain-containing protein, partial [Myxococcota bacterium]
MPKSPIPADALRWTCPDAWLGFGSTEELAPASGVVGQDSAHEALRFGVRIHAAGHHVFVRGIAGTGRRTLVLDTLKAVAPSSPAPSDHVYVHHFAEPGQPRRLTLPPGDGPRLYARAEELVRFVREDLSDHVNHDSLRARVRQIEASAGQQMAAVSGTFEAELASSGLTLVSTGENGAPPAILPMVEGQPLPFEQIPDPEAAAELRRRADRMMDAFQKVSAQIVGLRKASQQTVRELVQQQALDVMRA